MGNALRTLAAAIALAASSAPAASPHAAVSAPPIGQVTLDDGFWTPRVDTCRRATLPHCFRVCEQTGRIRNFWRAAGRLDGKFEGIWFNDSDVYKVVQGAAYALRIHPDARLEKLTDETIAAVAAAQQPDGYLYCFFTIANRDQRFKNIHRPRARHELYCMGHLIEAGAVHHEMTGKRSLLDVARRLADHIDSVFGPGKRYDVPEHQELELALIKLYRVTGERRYLDLARFFIDQRGNSERHQLYGEYAQDHAPVRRQSHAVGHAVRAMYNAIGMADLYMETGDRELLTACRRIWESATHRRMYVTGGVGATRRGEAFGRDYELPNEAAYAETCAQIGLALFAHRMFLIEPNAEYVDVMERVLYNGFLSGLSLDGTKFFYQNRLATRGDYRRQSWYGCACCPSNVVRVYPRIGQFQYASDKQSIYVNLYAAGRASVDVGGSEVALTQTTRHPWDGTVRIAVEPTQPRMFDLHIRVPGWCREGETPGGLYRTGLVRPFTISVNGKPLYAQPRSGGYIRIRREWGPSDMVDLHFPMPIRRVRAHEKIAAGRGRVALQRGPVVYCVEAVDHDAPIKHLFLPQDAPLEPEHRDDLLGGVIVLKGKAAVREAGSKTPRQVDVLAIPYYAWDNRKGGAMSVWLPERGDNVPPAPKPTIASRARASASHCLPSDSVDALNDQVLPPNSHDLGVPRHTFWPHKGTREWLQYDLAASARVGSVEVYWFDDRNTGGCRVPDSWRLLYRDGDAWQPVSGATPYGTERDQMNRVSLDPVETDGLRIELKLRAGSSGGVLEWRVHAAP